MATKKQLEVENNRLKDMLKYSPEEYDEFFRERCEELADKISKLQNQNIELSEEVTYLEDHAIVPKTLDDEYKIKALKILFDKCDSVQLESIISDF